MDVLTFESPNAKEQEGYGINGGASGGRLRCQWQPPFSARRPSHPSESDLLPPLTPISDNCGVRDETNAEGDFQGMCGETKTAKDPGRSLPG